MPTLNKVMLIGNLTRDPEVRFTPKGSAVCDLSLAINRTFSNDGGEKIEEVTFVDVVLWSKLAELAGKYLKKGRPVFIEGRLQMDSWEDKQTGQKRTRMRVVGEQMQFLGGAIEGQEQPAPRPARQPDRVVATTQHGHPVHESAISDGMEDDDIPF